MISHRRAKKLPTNNRKAAIPEEEKDKGHMLQYKRSPGPKNTAKQRARRRNRLRARKRQ